MNNYMSYKGYIAEVKYSDEDGCFIGCVPGLKHTSISFEGKTVKELKKDFEESIDFYLENCKKYKETPEVQCKGSLNVRIGPELHVKAKIRAESENISINELIKEALTKYLESA